MVSKLFMGRGFLDEEKRCAEDNEKIVNAVDHQFSHTFVILVDADARNDPEKLFSNLIFSIPTNEEQFLRDATCRS